MWGAAYTSRNPDGGKRHSHQYVCSTYANEVHRATCGRHPIDAPLVLRWLTQKLQEIYLGPGREALVQEIKKQLRSVPKANKRDVSRLQKRAVELDKEVNRLVKAIRTIDAAELTEELALVREEREQVKAQLAQAGKLADAADMDAEAEGIADRLWEIGERLTDTDPAIVRDVLKQFVYRITCRWERIGKKQLHSRLIGGKVDLWPQTPFSSPSSILGVGAHTSRRWNRGSTARSAAGSIHYRHNRRGIRKGGLRP